MFAGGQVESSRIRSNNVKNNEDTLKLWCANLGIAYLFASCCEQWQICLNMVETVRVLSILAHKTDKERWSVGYKDSHC